MSSSAESSVVVSLRELMELEDERLRAEAEREQRRHEEERRTEARAAEAAAALEARRRAELEEQACREERDRREEEARLDGVRRAATERALLERELLRVPPPDDLSGPLRRRMRSVTLALALTIGAWAASFLYVGSLYLRSDKATLVLLAGHRVEEETWNRARIELERRLAESEQSLREKTKELNEARRSRAALPALDPKPADNSWKRVEGHPQPKTEPRRPSCDPHDPMCGDLP